MEPATIQATVCGFSSLKNLARLAGTIRAAGPMLPMLSNPAILLDKYRPSAYIPDIPVTQTTRRSGAYT